MQLDSLFLVAQGKFSICANAASFVIPASLMSIWGQQRCRLANGTLPCPTTRTTCPVAYIGDFNNVVSDPFSNTTLLFGDLVYNSFFGISVVLPLAWVSGKVYISYCRLATVITFPALTGVGGYFFVGLGNDVLTFASLPSLVSVGNQFDFNGNVQLTSVDAPVLQSTGLYFQFYDCPRLTIVNVPSLSNVGTSLGVVLNAMVTAAFFPKVTCLYPVFFFDLCLDQLVFCRYWNLHHSP